MYKSFYYLILKGIINVLDISFSQNKYDKRKSMPNKNVFF